MENYLLGQVKSSFPSDNSGSPQVSPTELESPHPHLMLPKHSCFNPVSYTPPLT